MDEDSFEVSDANAELLKRLDDAKTRMATWNEARGPREAYRMSEMCPVVATHDKLDEAHYFFHSTLFTIHRPDEFRWNLNAFLQACRSVLYLAKAELSSRERFSDWWMGANDELHQNPVVRRVIDSRNFVVHERMLSQSSTVEAGLFHGSKMKLAFGGEPPNDWYSEALLRYEAFVWTGVYLDAEHSEVGVQFGVKREWRIRELGDGDVVVGCAEAYAAVRRFVARAHGFAGVLMPDEPSEFEGAHDPETYNLLLETDLDPNLAEQWWGTE